jgi:hypothetical protein
MSEIAILEAFAGMPDQRRKQGTRHSLQLCLALFTLAVSAGNQGFLAMGDWLKFHGSELKELFGVERLPSYSSFCKARFAEGQLQALCRQSRAIFQHNP